jgi:hypothetical protein
VSKRPVLGGISVKTGIVSVESHNFLSEQSAKNSVSQCLGSKGERQGGVGGGRV